MSDTSSSHVNASFLSGSTSRSDALPKLISSPFTGDLQCGEHDMLNPEQRAFPVKSLTSLGKITPGVTTCVADIRERLAANLIKGHKLCCVRTNAQNEGCKLE